MLIFSGHGTIQLARDLYEKSMKCDVWASGVEVSLTRYLLKDQMRECLAIVTDAAAQLAAVESIELSTGATPIRLKPAQRRILQLFSKFNSGANVPIRPLGGGLSETSVFGITVEDQNGALSSHAVAKIAAIRSLANEHARYQQFVAPVMSPGAFAPVIRFCNAGAWNYGGLFYSLASAHDHTLFDILSVNARKASNLVKKLRKLEEPWQTKAKLEDHTAGDIRRLFISDADFATVSPKLGFDWGRLEAMRISVPFCRQHFDLHGLNVLVRKGTDPIVIDYGEVGVGPACVDPLILELSVLFHPSAEGLRKSWPTAAQAGGWDDVQAFSGGTVIEPYISECRKWAHEIATRDSAVFATAYSFAVRQLKYRDTRHDLALEIAAAAYRRLTT